MIDIEGMSDISEAELKRLTGFSNRIAALEDLLAPEILPSEATHGEAPISLTAVYTPNWLKFQYLTNISESYLVDIKYLWAGGELGLESQTEELVNLIGCYLQIRNIGEGLLRKLESAPFVVWLIHLLYVCPSNACFHKCQQMPLVCNIFRLRAY